jgi:hypothetical protein
MESRLRVETFTAEFQYFVQKCEECIGDGDEQVAGETDIERGNVQNGVLNICCVECQNLTIIYMECQERKTVWGKILLAKNLEGKL